MSKYTGWLRWETQASIHHLALTADASQALMYKYFGFCWPKTILIYKGRDVIWSNDWDEIYKFGAEILDFYKDPGEKKKYIWDREKAVKRLFKVLDEIEEIDLSRLNKNDLAAIYKKFCDVYLHFWVIAWLDEPVAFECERILGEEGVTTNDLTILLTPTWRAFVAEIEEDLLKIAKSKEDEREKLIKLHLKKYFWKRNNYLQAYNVTAKEVEKELKTVKKTEANPVNKWKILSKLPRDSRTIVSIMDDFGRFQDERKRQMMIAAQYLEMLLAEIGKRVGLAIDDMRYTQRSEIEELLLKGKKLSIEISKRKKKCVLIFEGNKVSVGYGSEVDRVEKELFGSGKTPGVTELVGQTASSGTAIGKAVIVRSPKEINKVKEGNILIAPSTSPDYVVAMKKAAAIVTDWGGMTAHAAIVSRELGIPCVVGTDVATKVFKDGDVVEVLADEGIVRKV